MSSKTVRQAIAAWFQPPNVVGLNTVYSAKERRVPAGAYFTGTSNASTGMVAYPYVEEEVEEQIALVGNTPHSKKLIYHTALVLRGYSNQQLMSVAQDDFDDIIEGIKTRLRQDKNLGGQVFTIGLGQAPGQPDIRVQRDILHTDGNGGNGSIVFWAVVHFMTIEWLA